MADEAWREAERVWQIAPHDQAALEAAIATRQRADLQVPGAMLDARRTGPLEVTLPTSPRLGWLAVVVDDDGSIRDVGHLARRGATCRVPRCRRWWLEPRAADSTLAEEATAELLDLVRALGAPGLSLDLYQLCNGWESHVPALAGQLRWLRLHRSSDKGNELTDAGLRAIGELARLEALELDVAGDVAAAELTPDAFAALGRLTRLERLRLRTPVFPGGALARLAELEALSEVVLEAPGSPEALEQLGRCARLTRLTVAVEGRGELDLRPLARCAALERLHLRRSSFAGSGLEPLAALPVLEALTLTDCDLRPRALEALAALPALRELALESQSSLDRPALEAIAACPRLERLVLRDARALDPAALVALAPREGLDLWISGATTFDEDVGVRGLDDAALDAAARVLRLRGLALHECELVTGPAVAQAVARQPGLERLSFVHGATDELLQAAAAVPGLQTLVVDGPFGDAGVAALAAAPALRELTLCGPSVTGEGLARLAAAPRLERLALWSSFEEADLLRLAAFERLARLELPWRQSPLTGVRARLAAALPGCEVWDVPEPPVFDEAPPPPPAPAPPRAAPPPASPPAREPARSEPPPTLESRLWDISRAIGRDSIAEALELARSLEPESAQATLWLALLGEVPSRLAEVTAGQGWTADVIRWLHGPRDRAALLALANVGPKRERLRRTCDARCFLGLLAERTGDVPAALEAYGAALSASPSRTPTSELAGARRRRLEPEC